eukprot:CAMPEP_0113554512 /NCGR_PEP_ID=MMETSP0015_2-20120614/16194_1 /TAXON_ID=2838 /ORGANISM="Odontella" /LENGTH=161 /DNA_ID=CAMNT_0000455669 /DNA_START=60 /DNA_END=545 /DNA_ORIENTATION=- /assembly_acc=CAM_ASM_000160
MKLSLVTPLIVMLSAIVPASAFTPPTRALSRADSRPTGTAASLFERSEAESAKGVQAPTLTPAQDDALRDFASIAVDLHGYSWFRRPDCLEDARSRYPVLVELTDDEIAAAYLKQKPSFVEVFVKTPVGVFVGINLILWAAGFSWCDTPFGNPDACLPPPL